MLLLALPGLALADGPVGGCPTAPENESGLPGWFLSPPIADDVKFDKNGDGYICVKGVGQPEYEAMSKAPGNSVTIVFGGWGAVVKDNNQKLPEP
jgi:hypothetical protein